MAKTTPATRALDMLGIAYTLAVYDYNPGDERVGMQAAAAIGVDPARVFKTLMMEADGKPVCVLIPSDREAALKKVAALFGAKHAMMMVPTAAERLTGYHVGGISPLGQKRRVPMAVDASALTFDTVFVNGGQRGLQAQLAPADLIGALTAKTADLLGA
ncbi:MAG: Cys-tRNA(Pro) deacylase [Rhodospirillaceae bacterium]|nr:Cys-tRNA(Pro) deacylase [Rhodospirillaceae bacterium]